MVHVLACSIELWYEKNLKLLSARPFSCSLYHLNHIYKYSNLYRKVGVLSIRIVKSNVSSVSPSSEKMRVLLGLGSCFCLTKGQHSKR